MQNKTRDFISKPIGGPFGTSVELNQLQDVIDYEEGRIEPIYGYPRFVAHPSVTDREKLAKTATGSPYTVAFSSLQQAHFILDDFISRHYPANDLFSLEPEAHKLLSCMHTTPKTSRFFTDKKRLTLVEVDGLHIACLKVESDYKKLVTLRRVWGTGFDVHQLSGLPLEGGGNGNEQVISKTLCDLEGENGAGTCLFQSGMAAISSIIMHAIKSNRRVVLVGPAYVDTGTIISRWPYELTPFDATWFGETFTKQELESVLSEGPSLVLLEAPTNPRLTLPNIPMLVETAKQYDSLLAIDATIATPANLKALDLGFDLVMHSTSKFLGGRYNHLGGIITARSDSLYQSIKTIRDAVDLGMCQNQISVLQANLHGFAKRMATINDNTQEIVRRLSDSPYVAKVFYPGSRSLQEEALATSLFQSGRSGLLSFLLEDPSIAALQRFYDQVSTPILKGPGFGGETSLICPYVMLAHYHDDEAFLQEQGLHRHLLRLSVGCEPVDDIWTALHLNRTR